MAPDETTGIALDPTEQDLDQAAEMLRLEEERRQGQGEPANEPAGESTAEPTAGAADDELTYEDLGDGRFRWQDGVVTDAQGEEIKDEAPAPDVTAPAPTPTPRTEARPEPTAAYPAQQQAQPIYTREQVEEAIYTEAVLNELSDLQLTDPVKAQKRQIELQGKYQTGLRWLNNHASNQFDREWELYAQEVPEIDRYARKIMQVKQGLEPEQLQQPGAARWVINQIVTEEMMSDTMRVRDYLTRSLPQQRANPGAGQPPGSAPAPTKVTPKRDLSKVPIIPPSGKLAAPGTIRRLQAAPPQAASRDSYVRVLMQQGYAEADALEAAEIYREQDKLRRRRA